MHKKTGVVLINLGTPDAPSETAVRRYLKEFLSDRRVIDNSGLVRWLLLNGIILPRRAKEFSQAYALIWNAEHDESPLRTITRSQAEKVSAGFAADPNVQVDWAMRYGTPSIGDAIANLLDAGCRQVLFFPLYPQYSAATTASAMDKVFECLGRLRWQPAVRTVPAYFDDPVYIEALAQSLTNHHLRLGWTPDLTVISFHGLPKEFIDKGDPYQRQCERTAALVRHKMGSDDIRMPLAYQSSSGRPGWLGPELQATLVGLARNGVKHLTVIAPGFSADCVETLEEIEIRAAKTYREAGGTNFSMVPCLNDTDASIEAIRKLVARNLLGWN